MSSSARTEEIERTLALRRLEGERRSTSEVDVAGSPGVWGDKYHLKPATVTPRPRPTEAQAEAPGPGALGSHVLLALEPEQRLAQESEESRDEAARVPRLRRERPELVGSRDGDAEDSDEATTPSPSEEDDLGQALALSDQGEAEATTPNPSEEEDHGQALAFSDQEEAEVITTIPAYDVKSDQSQRVAAQGEAELPNLPQSSEETFPTQSCLDNQSPLPEPHSEQPDGAAVDADQVITSIPACDVNSDQSQRVAARGEAELPNLPQSSEETFPTQSCLNNQSPLPEPHSEQLDSAAVDADQEASQTPTSSPHAPFSPEVPRDAVASQLEDTCPIQTQSPEQHSENPEPAVVGAHQDASPVQTSGPDFLPSWEQNCEGEAAQDQLEEEPARSSEGQPEVTPEDGDGDVQEDFRKAELEIAGTSDHTLHQVDWEEDPSPRLLPAGSLVQEEEPGDLPELHHVASPAEPAAPEGSAAADETPGAELQQQQQEPHDSGVSPSNFKPLASITSLGSMAGNFASRAVAGLLDVMPWPDPGQGSNDSGKTSGTSPDQVMRDAATQVLNSAYLPSNQPQQWNVDLDHAPLMALPASPTEDRLAGLEPPSATLEELRESSRPSFIPTSRAVLPSESAIWESILSGDVRRLQCLAECGALTSAGLRDENGQTIFWAAVAFRQAEVALWLLKRFPPNLQSGLGVDIQETHQRRADTLLHLAASLTHFTPATAELFWVLLHGGGPGSGASWSVPLRHKNKEGQNFIHVAANHLNFWILHSVLNSVSDGSALFVEEDNGGLSPAVLLLKRAAEVGGPLPAPPKPGTLHAEAQVPPWWQLSRHLPGLPFVDIWLEVEDARAPDNLFRAPANRVILAASSRVLKKEVDKLPLGKPLRIDPSCCRSGEALQMALRFLYGGDPRSVFAASALDIWQLWRLCLRYGLPPPLTSHARAALLRILSEPRGATLLPAVLEVADEVGLDQNEATALAWHLLTQIQVLRPLGGDGSAGAGTGLRAKALLAALLRVERHVFDGVERKHMHKHGHRH